MPRAAARWRAGPPASGAGDPLAGGDARHRADDAAAPGTLLARLLHSRHALPAQMLGITIVGVFLLVDAMFGTEADFVFEPNLANYARAQARRE